MTKNKEIVCRLCKKPINTKKDVYCHIKDYREGKLFDEAYYHTLCYVDKIKKRDETKKVIDKAMQILNVLGTRLEIPEEKEVVEIK